MHLPHSTQMQVDLKDKFSVVKLLDQITFATHPHQPNVLWSWFNLKNLKGEHGKRNWSFKRSDSIWSLNWIWLTQSDWVTAVFKTIVASPLLLEHKYLELQKMLVIGPCHLQLCLPPPPPVHWPLSLPRIHQTCSFPRGSLFSSFARTSAHLPYSQCYSFTSLTWFWSLPRTGLLRP